MESEVGIGSTFTFTLPLPAAVVRADPATAGSKGPAVLLVEDDPRAAQLLTVYLSAANFDVAISHDGQDGLQMAHELHPLAIILDIMLPRLDGWDFLARAKADPEIAGIPIIIVSVLDERGKGIALGAAEYIVKPVRREDLTAALEHLGLMAKVLNARAKVLIIDDDPLAIELVAAVLQPEGYTVLKAKDGTTGLALAENELPSLIILDLLMPGLDGFTVVERLRAAPATSRIPVIILTSKSMTSEEKQRLNGQISYLAQKADFNQAAFVESVRAFTMIE